MLEVDGDDDAALPSTESCRWRRVMVAVFRRFFGDIPTNNLITSTLKGILTSIIIIITLQHRKTQNLHTTSLPKQ
jgi:hypothetical protein